MESTQARGVPTGSELHTLPVSGGLQLEQLRVPDVGLEQLLVRAELRDLPAGDAADANGILIGVVMAQQQLHNRTLTGSVLAHERNELAISNVQV